MQPVCFDLADICFQFSGLWIPTSGFRNHFERAVLVRHQFDRLPCYRQQQCQQQDHDRQQDAHQSSPTSDFVRVGDDRYGLLRASFFRRFSLLREKINSFHTFPFFAALLTLAKMFRKECAALL